MTDILATTINPESLTLGDWIAIAKVREFKLRWALEAWMESTSSDVLGNLTLEDWEAIADAIEYTEGWAYHRYKEFRSKEAISGTV